MTYIAPASVQPVHPQTDPASPAAPDPHPTLKALAATHFGGHVPALIRLLDALDVATVREARIERHHAWPASPQ